MKSAWSSILLVVLIFGFLNGATSSIIAVDAVDLSGANTANPPVDEPLIFSTLTGFRDYDSVVGVGMDEKGDIYAVGMTDDTGDYENRRDGFLIKINGTDFSQEFEVVFGGSDYESVSDTFIDPTGRVYVTGHTSSPDFPVKNGYSDVLQNSTDCFIICFDSNGSVLFSTLLGGYGSDRSESIFVDTEGSIYITGKTQSSNFPLINSYSNFTGGDWVFVSKLNSTGNGLIYSSIVEEDSIGFTITADSEGNAYVAGVTISEDFPTINAYSETPNQIIPYEANEGFVFKMNSTGNGLIFSTFIGGTDSEIFYDIELDSQGDVWVCGYTGSSDFPSVGNFSEFIEASECVVFELSSNGSALLFSTVFGGSEDDGCWSMDFDERDNLYVTGSTRARQFPLVRPERSLFDYNDQRDFQRSNCFVMKIGPEKSILYSTLIGGSLDDRGQSIEVIENGAVIIGGDSYSESFPVRREISDGSYDLKSNRDGFVLILLDISDEDGDNIPNWWEIVNGYDPFDSNTPFFEVLVWNIRIVVAISVFSIIAITAIWSDKERIRSWTNKTATDPDAKANE